LETELCTLIDEFAAWREGAGNCAHDKNEIELPNATEWDNKGPRAMSPGGSIVRTDAYPLGDHVKAKHCSRSCSPTRDATSFSDSKNGGYSHAAPSSDNDATAKHSNLESDEGAQCQVLPTAESDDGDSLSSARQPVLPHKSDSNKYVNNISHHEDDDVVSGLGDEGVDDGSSPGVGCCNDTDDDGNDDKAKNNAGREVKKAKQSMLRLPIPMLRAPMEIVALVEPVPIVATRTRVPRRAYLRFLHPV
jgi:hypothetical protein